MAQAATLTRENRTIPVDSHDETTYFGLLGNPRAFVAFVLAFLLALGSQLLHKASCSAGGGLTRQGAWVLSLGAQHGMSFPKIQNHYTP